MRKLSSVPNDRKITKRVHTANRDPRKKIRGKNLSVNRTRPKSTKGPSLLTKNIVSAKIHSENNQKTFQTAEKNTKAVMVTLGLFFTGTRILSSQTSSPGLEIFLNL